MTTNETECVCGRLGIHCPVCGVANVYHVKTLSVKTSDLEQFPNGVIRGFRCRKCGAEFRETTDCTASAPTAIKTRNASEDFAVDKNIQPTPESRRTLLATLRSLKMFDKADQLEKEYQEKGLL